MGIKRKMATSMEVEFEAQVEALGQLEGLKREKDDILEQRKPNLPANVAATRKLHLSNKSSLKSDLKKTTAFVKKIKSINTEGLLQCIRDVESLNLSLYVSEIVNAIVETNFKATDVPNMVKLSVCLHQRYEEFTSSLLPALRSSLIAVPSDDDKEAGKKRRIQIRFTMELFQAGVWTDDAFFCELLAFLLGKTKVGNVKPAVDLMSLGTFVKYGSEILLGYVPRRIQQLARAAGVAETSAPILLLASNKISNDMRMMVNEIYGQLSKKLVDSHKEYRSKEKRMEKDKLIHGSITEQKQLELDNCKKLFEKFHSVVLGLSENIGEDVPILEEDKEEEDNTKKLSVWEGNAVSGDFGPHGDAETKAFYEDLPDLLVLVPLTVLGLTPEQAASLKEEWKLSKEKTYLAGEGEDAQTDTAVDSGENVVAPEIIAVTEAQEDETNVLKEKEVPSATSTAGTSTTDSESKPDEEKEKSSQPTEDSVQSRVLALLEKLPDCVNKQRADEFSVAYAHYNGKGARKKLITALSRIPRSRIELAATYARIVASMSRIFPVIGTSVLESIRGEFFGQMKNSKVVSQFIDNRVRTVRYAAELVKFGVAPPITVFRMFKSLLSDFTYHNVELVAVLLEACGRYLYLLPYTHDRLEEVLETMLRMRRAKNLDPRQQNLIEMAYFAVKPPERKEREKKVLSNVQQYAKYLILERLDSPGVNVDSMIDSLRRLPWNKPEEDLEDIVLRAVLKLARKKYVSIGLLADCMSGLNKSCPNLLIRLVDRVLEEIQHGLDHPMKREPQRMLGMTRLLGELYNYAVISSAVIFETLFHLINFGHEVSLLVTLQSSSQPTQGNVSVLSPEVIASLSHLHDPRVPSDLDPINDLFRAQLVCELLNTCGSYYVRGQAKVKLSRFMVYFQRYLLTKPSLPMHVEFTILDTFDSLEDQARSVQYEKPKSDDTGDVGGLMFPRYDSMESVQAAVVILEAKNDSQVAAEEEEAEEEERRAQERERESSEHNQAGPVDSGDKDEEGGSDGSDDDDDEEGSEDDSDDDDGSDSGEDDIDADDDMSDQAAARMLESMRAAEEDEEFEKAFKSLMQESVESVKSSTGGHKAVSLNRMAIPAVLPKLKNVVHGAEEVDDEDIPERKKGMAFKLLSRDSKGRVEARELMVPQGASMAVKLVKSEAENRIEKQKLKEKVLMIESLTMSEQSGPCSDMPEDYGDVRDKVEYVAPKTVPTSLTGEDVGRSGNRFDPKFPNNRPGGGGGGGGSGSGGNNNAPGRDTFSGPGSFGKNNESKSSNYRATGYVAFGSFGDRPRTNQQVQVKKDSRISSVRAQETRRPANSLNFDELLAETSASEIRRLGQR